MALFGAAMALFAGPSSAQQAVEWEDPAVFAVNREPPRASFFALESRSLALAGDVPASSLVRSLNGSWKFHWVERSAERPPGFFEEAFDDSGW